jgi:hypothetical protein
MDLLEVQAVVQVHPKFLVTVQKLVVLELPIRVMQVEMLQGQVPLMVVVVEAVVLALLVLMVQQVLVVMAVLV